MKYSLSPSLTISLGFAARPRAPSFEPSASSMASPAMPRLELQPLLRWHLVHLAHRDLGQLGDLLHEVDPPDDQPHLGVLVLFARVVRDADEAFELHLRLVVVGDRQVVGRPAYAAGEIGDLDRRLAVQLALDVPVEHLRLVVGKGGVEDFELIGMGEEAEADGRGVDERVGPTELQAGWRPLKLTLRVSRTSVRSSEL